MATSRDQLQQIAADLMWDLPETARASGNIAMLIGTADALGAASGAYEAARDTTTVNFRLLVPKQIKDLTAALPQHEVHLLEAERNRSLGLKTMPDLRAADTWADCLLLPDGVGRSSETSLLLSKFLADANSRLILAGSAANIVVHDDWIARRQSDTVLITNFRVMQKLSLSLGDVEALQRSDNLQVMIAKMAAIAQVLDCGCVIVGEGNFIVIDQTGSNSVITGGSAEMSNEIAGRLAAILSKRHLDLATLQTAVVQTI